MSWLTIRSIEFVPPAPDADPPAAAKLVLDGDARELHPSALRGLALAGSAVVEMLLADASPAGSVVADPLIAAGMRKTSDGVYTIPDEMLDPKIAQADEMAARGATFPMRGDPIPVRLPTAGSPIREVPPSEDMARTARMVQKASPRKSPKRKSNAPPRK